MSTRLDRLFLLLDTGSTPLIRRSAAEQLGDVVQLHPHELGNLLNKVHGFLKNSSWETRIAASQAVEAIAKKVPQWEPKVVVKDDPDASDHKTTVSGMVLFSRFDINHVLSCGASLLASEGNQFDVVQPKNLGMDDKEQLMQQRQLLNKRLGLDGAGSLGFDSSSLFNDDDLKIHVASINNNSKSVEEVLAQQLPKTEFQLSSREKNVAKRKARSLSKQLCSSIVSEDGTITKRVKRERSDGSMDSVDSTSMGEESEDWPFQSFCEVLINDLFHPSWEIRHGAACGLREVIKHHGRGAGKNVDVPVAQLHLVNQVWLSDLALRLLCVLALDRFGDFVSDEVVAPVRETCAQTLGAILKYMEADTVTAVVQVSLALLVREEWEVRHAALLILKYSLAVRQDMTSYLLPVVLPSALQGLKDPDDDVRAVAAAALFPVSNAIVDCMAAQVPSILTCLWDTLCDLDDLTASTNSIMILLARLTALSVNNNNNSKETTFKEMSLTGLTPRLWPFLRHNIVSVRRAALDTLQTILKVYDVPTTSQWLAPIYQDAIRHIYQRSFLEIKPELLPLIVSTWELLLERGIPAHLAAVTLPWLGVWLAFLMQPSHMAFDSTLLIETKHKPRTPNTVKARAQAEVRPTVVVNSKYFIGGFEMMPNSCNAESDMAINRSRLCGARLFGMLADRLCQSQSQIPLTAEMESPSMTFGKLFSFHLSGKSALQRFVVGYVIYFWALLCKSCLFPNNVKVQLLACLEEPILYDEMAFALTRLQTDCRDLLAYLKLQEINLDDTFPPNQLLTVESSLHLTNQVYPQVRAALKPPMQSKFDERVRQLQAFTTQTGQDQQQYNVRVLCSLAMAVVALDALPEKLNPVVRPLMDSVKKEENTMLQEEAASCLAQLIQLCRSRTPSPNAKVIKNLCNFLCSDPNTTPCVTNPPPTHASASQGLDQVASCSQHKGILTLSNLQKASAKHPRPRQRRVASATKGEAKGETNAVSGHALTSDVDFNVSESAEAIEAQRLLSIQRQGAETAVTVVARTFQKDLPSILPILWDVCVNGVSTPRNLSDDISSEVDMDATQIQELVNALQTIEVLIPALHPDLLPTLLQHLDQLKILLSNKWTAIRHMSGRVMAALSLSNTSRVMHFLVDSVLPLLEVMANDKMREGSIETVTNIVEHLSMACLPYLVVLVIPVLGRMSDQNWNVRMMATHCFANLIRLMPLEAGVPDPPDMEKWLIQRKEKERKFLDQLFDMSKLDDYPITVPVQAELRKYQQDGVNWLGFLNKYKLHGILCDDMGLGKTLQSICILASDHFDKENKYKELLHPELHPLPSIVVCPPTLVGHWLYEINKFVDKKYLNPLMYSGPPKERCRLQKLVKHHNLIIASYEVIRNDLDFFGKMKWNYCILDEGHIIRNGKTKLSKAVKSLVSNYRLILSGTPIQNNVLDLWSLFDFLMPGFLGTERQFQNRFGRPIIQSRDAKSTSKEQEAGSLAMESLHRQVLPFILRRMKEDVLKDLPPKIMQDYFSDLSPLQMELYEDFAKSRARQGVDDTVAGEDRDKDKSTVAQGTTHIFQALQYLRKLCNHPALVINMTHPRYAEITAQLSARNSSLHDPSHAPKLIALKQLLNDCGIGLTANPSIGSCLSSSNQGGIDDMPVVNQHRVLLFCQLKSMLDIVEKDLLKMQMPSVTYLRLDGTVPAANRHDIVHRFNSDPSIDILLLTTHVGGLGLNLTGADTVIFVEHDWNPMKDLQAMDRAHRIGQKKVVNVYRLITRGTLEEKIMNLQKFKMAVANTIISQDNSSLGTMGTEQLLDLFVLDQTSAASAASSNNDDKTTKDKRNTSAAGAAAAAKKSNIKTILDGLDELWDESQYENEYDVATFMKSLGSVR